MRKLTPEVAKRVLELARQATPLHAICADAGVGINRDTLREWLQRGETELRRRAAGETPNYAMDAAVQLAEGYRKAEVEAAVVASMVASVEPSERELLVEPGPRISAAQARRWLARRHPELSRKAIRKLVCDSIIETAKRLAAEQLSGPAKGE